MFHNTGCTANEANVAVLAGTDVSCTNTGPYCVDSGERTGDYDCQYTRKLCVKCTEDAGSVVRLKVQGNGLPVNCFYGSAQVVEQNIDYEVIWNPSVSNTSYRDDYD